MLAKWDLRQRLLLAIGFMSAASLTLLGFRFILTGTLRFWFMTWNLALAWMAILFATLLVDHLRKTVWSSWQNLILTAAWLVFLPNTWYILTDFIHVYPSGEISQLYDVVLVSLSVFTGFALGTASLLMVHLELAKRLSFKRAWLLIEFIILLSSFAIYLGRDLRWNSWDVITNPGGVLANVSDQIIDPFGNPRALNVTLLFFVTINAVYLTCWLLAWPQLNKPRR
jgi:uncharacterized membrane protein